MKALYRFFRSKRLAFALLLVITLLSILATLVPQGGKKETYQAAYPALLSRAILALHFDRFFSSELFFAVAALFTANLGVCAIDRLLARRRAGGPRRYGPDLVHLGLLLLVAGAILTTALRQEKLFFLAEGEREEIGGGYVVQLLSFQFLKYESGAPKDWISTVSVLAGDGVRIASAPIEVNKPLRLGTLRIYQSSYSTEGTTEMEVSPGKTVSVKTGEAFRIGDVFWYFADVEPAAAGNPAVAIFQKWVGGARVSTLKVSAPGMVGPLPVARISVRRLTGLKAVRDPGFFLVVAALIVAGSGLALTYIQKLGDMKA